ncbi:acyltransferase family protein [Geothrix campi]|uniref:acyltransferase family protein n=1 Tax=Geothrix campi TaxID=2966450 RepID=UPI0021485D5C|nr:acyltransferase [Geothrix sp. SG10]
MVLISAPVEPRPTRFGLLDPLRGILALCVAVYHLGVWFNISQSGGGANIAMARLGNYSVSGFFVLSGFVLFRTTPWSRVRKERPGRFWLRRFLRLAPVFYLVCALNVSLGLGMGPEVSLRFILENLTLTFGAIHPNHALVTGGWYVGLVALLYFAYPLLAWLREKAGPRGGLVFLAALALGLWAWSLPSTLHGVMGQPLWNRFHTYVLAPNQVFLLAWGALLAGLHAGTEKRLEPKLALLLALPLVWLLIKPTPRFFDHLAALTGWLRYGYLLAVTGLVALAAFTRDGEPGWFGKQLTRLGAWSYGIYLLHPFTMKLVAPQVSGLPGFSLALGLAILAAWAVHRWIEEPMGKLGRGAKG